MVFPSIHGFSRSHHARHQDLGQEMQPPLGSPVPHPGGVFRAATGRPGLGEDVSMFQVVKVKKTSMTGRAEMIEMGRVIS